MFPILLWWLSAQTDPQCNKEPCPLLFSSQDNGLFDSTSSNGGCCSIKRASMFLEKKREKKKTHQAKFMQNSPICALMHRLLLDYHSAPCGMCQPIHLRPVDAHLHQQTLVRVWGSMIATHVQDSRTNTSYGTNNTFLM